MRSLGCGMFIVRRNSLNLRKSFFWWFGILSFGALALTMHVHYRDGAILHENMRVAFQMVGRT